VFVKVLALLASAELYDEQFFCSDVDPDPGPVFILPQCGFGSESGDPKQCGPVVRLCRGKTLSFYMKNVPKVIC
jgi:hypothetical protein